MMSFWRQRRSWKRQVARRRNKTRNRKRKNVIRGGLPLNKALAFAAALFEVIKNDNSLHNKYLKNKEYGPDDHTELLENIGEKTVNKLAKEAAKENVHLDSDAKWDEYAYYDVINPNDDSDEIKIQRMERSRGKSKYDKL
jgi:hypothetical protein